MMLQYQKAAQHCKAQKDLWTNISSDNNHTEMKKKKKEYNLLV